MLTTHRHLDLWSYEYPNSISHLRRGLRSVPAELYSFFLMTTTKENTGRNFNFEEARGKIIS